MSEKLEQELSQLEKKTIIDLKQVEEKSSSKWKKDISQLENQTTTLLQHEIKMLADTIGSQMAKEVEKVSERNLSEVENQVGCVRIELGEELTILKGKFSAIDDQLTESSETAKVNTETLESKVLQHLANFEETTSKSMDTKLTTVEKELDETRVKFFLIGLCSSPTASSFTSIVGACHILALTCVNSCVSILEEIRCWFAPVWVSSVECAGRALVAYFISQ